MECQQHILFHGIDLHQYHRRPINIHHRLPPQQSRPPNVIRVHAHARQDHFPNEKRQRRALGQERQAIRRIPAQARKDSGPQNGGSRCSGSNPSSRRPGAFCSATPGPQAPTRHHLLQSWSSATRVAPLPGVREQSTRSKAETSSATAALGPSSDSDQLPATAAQPREGSHRPFPSNTGYLKKHSPGPRPSSADPPTHEEV
jgi:hypothetical protein